VQTGYGVTAESEVDAHEPGKQHPDQSSDQRQRVILFADDFVVEAEDMFPEKACRGSVHAPRDVPTYRALRFPQTKCIQIQIC
jgi:hypothetical protein